MPPKMQLEFTERFKNEGWHPDTVPDYVNQLGRMRKTVLISSWTATEKESFAMWKMYSKEKLGVAVKTDFEHLKRSFDNASESIYIGEVQYYDDDKPIQDGKSVLFFSCKKHLL